MKIAASLVALLLVSACAATGVPAGAIKTCHASTDCGGGQSCLFAVYESCGMPGVCTAAPDGSACISQTACGCNGATVSVCLVNGNSPSPITSLGSCDGATQQGFDATVAEGSAPPPPPPPDASDSGGTTPTDSGAPSDDASAADASDASNGTLLGTPCTSSSQCSTDPVYRGCHFVGGNEICTTTCPTGLDSQCQPPSNGVCNTAGATFYCALN
jgi:hypothetical protein